MKPAVFAYHAPEKLAEAIALLVSCGEDAKLLAGGQSLVPLMNFRLTRPAVLVDINHIAELDYVTDGASSLRVGALTRQVALERQRIAGPLGELIQKTIPYIGHLPIRARGTVGGSLAHADPSAEACLLSLTLDATVVARGPNGERSIPAESFFQTVFTTALEPDEILTEIQLPALPAAARVGFVEFSRRAGDFAVVAVMVVVVLDRRGRISEARVGLGGAADRPMRASSAESVLLGQVPDEALFREAGTEAVKSADPLGDVHGSSEYRQDLVRALVPRALRQALTSS